MRHTLRALDFFIFSQRIIFERPAFNEFFDSQPVFAALGPPGGSR